MNAFELKSNPMLMIEVVSSCSAKCITKSNLRGIFFLVHTYLFGKIKSTLSKNVILQKLFFSCCKMSYIWPKFGTSTIIF